MKNEIIFTALALLFILVLVFAMRTRLLFVVTVSIQTDEGFIVHQSSYVFTTPKQAVEQRDTLLERFKDKRGVTVSLMRDVVINQEAV